MAESNRSAAKKASDKKAEQEKAEQVQAEQAEANPAQDEQPSDSDVAKASEPGGQPGAVLPRPDKVEGMSSAKATPMQGAPGDVEDYASSLEAPTDRKVQSYPEGGYALSSTDAAYAAAGGRTVAGEQHGGLVDDEGNEVSASDLFNDEDGKTFVTASKRVYEQFYYPNTTEKASRLLFVEGQRVNRAEAERIKASLG